VAQLGVDGKGVAGSVEAEDDGRPSEPEPTWIIIIIIIIITGSPRRLGRVSVTAATRRATGPVWSVEDSERDHEGELEQSKDEVEPLTDVQQRLGNPAERLHVHNAFLAPVPLSGNDVFQVRGISTTGTG